MQRQFQALFALSLLKEKRANGLPVLQHVHAHDRKQNATRQQTFQYQLNKRSTPETAVDPSGLPPGTGLGSAAEPLEAPWPCHTPVSSVTQKTRR